MRIWKEDDERQQVIHVIGAINRGSNKLRLLIGTNEG